MGVSDQSAEEIALDTGKEALIAGAAELTFGAPFAIFKAFKPKAGVIEEGGEHSSMLVKLSPQDISPLRGKWA